MKLRILLFTLLSLMLPALCLAAPKKKKPPVVDDRGLKVVKKLDGDSRQRVALVIGNSNYVSSPLKNPANDARVMAASLRRLGFEVVEKTNLGYADMNEVVELFGNRLKSGGVALFYYAGHGMQVNGNNYLIPTDARINAESEVRYKAVDAGLVLSKMEQAKSDVNIVVLDACRDNPFARSFRSSASGLASMEAPNGTFIAYATAPGKTAADGSGSNGLYTQELIKVLETPWLKLEDIFKRTSRAVKEQSANKQSPWVASNFDGDFWFVPPTKAELRPQPAAQQSQSSSFSSDIPVSVSSAGITTQFSGVFKGRRIVVMIIPGKMDSADAPMILDNVRAEIRRSLTAAEYTVIDSDDDAVNQALTEEADYSKMVKHMNSIADKFADKGELLVIGKVDMNIAPQGSAYVYRALMSGKTVSLASRDLMWEGNPEGAALATEEEAKAAIRLAAIAGGKKFATEVVNALNTKTFTQERRGARFELVLPTGGNYRVERSVLKMLSEDIKGLKNVSQKNRGKGDIVVDLYYAGKISDLVDLLMDNFEKNSSLKGWSPEIRGNQVVFK